jgi:hypothetical protein
MPLPLRPPVHERQSLLHCALHAVNNLTQNQPDPGPPFTAPAFAALASELHAEERRLGSGAWLNPHCALLPVGDWGVEVVARALGARGLALAHCPPAQRGSAARLARARGLLLNRASRGWLAAALGGRHWVALAPLEEVGGGEAAWYDLDSAAAAPRRVGGLEDVLALLAAEPVGTHVFDVTGAAAEAAGAPAAAAAAAAAAGAGAGTGTDAL